MPRISTVSKEQAPAASKPMLDAIQGKLGRVPNLLATLAHSPAALATYVNLNEALGKGTLGAGFREQLAVAIANESGCAYCASAHTAIGKSLGVPADELKKNLGGKASDPKVQAGIDFAVALVEKRGFAEDADLKAARDAGLTDAEVLEILAVTVTNLFTNYANHLIETENDFPKVELAQTAGAR